RDRRCGAEAFAGLAAPGLAIAAERGHHLVVAVHVVAAVPLRAAAGILIERKRRGPGFSGRTGFRRARDLRGLRTAAGRIGKAVDEARVFEIHRTGVAEIPEITRMIGPSRIA